MNFKVIEKKSNTKQIYGKKQLRLELTFILKMTKKQYIKLSEELVL